MGTTELQKSRVNDFVEDDEKKKKKKKTGEPKMRGNQLKMFWEKGMMWQENPARRSWCAEARDSKAEDGNLYIIIKECNKDNPYQRWSFSRQGLVRPTYIQKLCITSRPKIIEGRVRLDTCNEKDNRESLTFNLKYDKKFQFYPIANKAICLTQGHHPTEGEALLLQDCEKAENNDKGIYDDTSHWVIGIFDGH